MDSTQIPWVELRPGEFYDFNRRYINKIIVLYELDFQFPGFKWK